MRVGDGRDHRQTKPAAPTVPRARCIGAPEGIEHALCRGRRNARPIVLDTQHASLCVETEGDAHGAGNGILTGVLQQGQQHLAQADRIAVPVPGIEAEFDTVASRLQRRLEYVDHLAQLGRQIGFDHLPMQLPAPHQAEHSQILDQPCQFLIAAVLVCLIGGALGVVLAATVGAVFNHFAQDAGFRMLLSMPAIAGAFAVSLLIGISFGFAPAPPAAWPRSFILK